MDGNETQSAKERYLIVGLGNPGRRYRNNRHNAGFMALDRLAARLGVGFARLQSKALVTDAQIDGTPLLLAKPQTFMNASGQAVQGLVRFYKITAEDLLLVIDDIDLPFGNLRLRPAGGSGGHQGLRSVIAQLGHSDFPRLRIGVGRPPGNTDPADYVLRDFGKAETDSLAEVLERAVDSILAFTHLGIEHAMTEYNRLNS